MLAVAFLGCSGAEVASYRLWRSSLQAGVDKFCEFASVQYQAQVTFDDSWLCGVVSQA